MTEKKYMTVVFECDVRSVKGNPHLIDTPFGLPQAIRVGNALERLGDLEDEIEGLYEDAAGSSI